MLTYIMIVYIYPLCFFVLFGKIRIHSVVFFDVVPLIVAIVYNKCHYFQK